MSSHTVPDCRCVFFDLFSASSNAVCASCFDNGCKCLEEKSKPKELDRFEALDLLVKVQAELEAGRYGTAMKLVGMTDDLFPEGQTLEELTQAFSVRLGDLTKKAGLQV